MLSPSQLHGELTGRAATPGKTNGGANMKRSIAGLQEEARRHHGRLTTVESTVDGLVQSTKRGESGFREALGALQERMEKQMREMQDEHQHRFSLQVAENKRLLVHLNAQKAEMQALQKRMVSLEDRVAFLEAEIGDDEPMPSGDVVDSPANS